MMPCKHEQLLQHPHDPGVVVCFCWRALPQPGVTGIVEYSFDMKPCEPGKWCYEEVDPHELVRAVARVAARLFGDD